MEKQIWMGQQLAIVAGKTSNYTDRQINMANIAYLKSAIEIMPEKIEQQDAYDYFRQRMEQLTALLPEKETPTAQISFKAYYRELTAFKGYVTKTYKMVPKPYYIGIMMSMGIAIGVAIGISFKNIGIGIAMGVGIGVGIGSYLDNKATKEGRVLG